MGEYTEALIWFTSWPILIFVAYKFVVLNLKHFDAIEKLKDYERND